MGVESIGDIAVDLIGDVLDAAGDGHISTGEASEVAARAVDAALHGIDIGELLVEVAQRIGESLQGDRPEKLRRRAARKHARADALEAKAAEIEATS